MPTFDNMSALRIASHCAMSAHEGQFRKDGKTPYITHPARVAGLVASYGSTVNAQIAAWLHDTVEDVEEFDLDEVLGKMDRFLHAEDIDKIREMVIAMTKNDTLVPRKARMIDAIDRVVALHEKNPEIVLLKICDRIDNLIDSDGMKESFVSTYLVESKYMHDRFKPCVEKEGNTSHKAALHLLWYIIEKKSEIYGCSYHVP
jgi:(p)ppGpp synthase/HD superfamily hydrolase